MNSSLPHGSSIVQCMCMYIFLSLASQRERERVGGIIMAQTPAVVLVVICCCTTTHLLLLLPTAEAIWLNLPSSGTKCVSEEIQNHVVVLADYGVVGDDTHRGALPTISASVTSPFGNNLHHQENVTHGQFAFTTKEAGNYGACFWVDGNHQGGQDVPVSLEWRIGVNAKDWETVARKEKIEGVELELMKLEGAVQAIHQNLIYLKDREAEMREVSERTNSRVAWFSIMSLGVCIVVSGLQLWHLKSFFRKKKLI